MLLIFGPSVSPMGVELLENPQSFDDGPTSDLHGTFGTTGTHIRLGIDSNAHIGDFSLGYGLQYPIGFYNEHLAEGWWGEGFYFGYFVDNYLYQGWSYESWPGISGLVFISETTTDTPTESRDVIILRSADSLLEFTHDFLFQKADKFVILKVNIKNIGSETITGLRYRRMVDWDMDVRKYGFNNYWDYLEDTDGKPIMMAWKDHYGALASSSLTPHTRHDAYGWGDEYGYSAYVDIIDPNGLYYDFNVFFEWEKDLTPGESIEAIMYYILGDSKAEILSGYEAAEAKLVIPVSIDIKPGSDPNSINPKSKGVIPVAILNDGTFDPTLVDPVTVIFGPGEASPVKWALEDVDDDGDIDLVMHFKTQETGFQSGDTLAILDGNLFDGRKIQGEDSVNIVPPKG